MSIASEITRIDNEVSSQTDLMAQIQTALEGKTAASGGASVDTCTVTIASSVGSGICGFTTYKDGNFNAESFFLYPPPTVTNVVCGTMFTVVGIENYIPTYTNATEINMSAGDIDGIYVSIARIDATAGGTVTIS